MASFLRSLTNHLMQRFLQTIRAIQGASIVASSIQIILGYSQLWGICSRFITSNSLTPCHCTCSTLANLILFVHVNRFFSPLGMVPVVAAVGFGLFNRGFPVVSYHFYLTIWSLANYVLCHSSYCHVNIR